MSLFNQVPKAKIQRSSFDLSHSRKLSMRMGELVPVFVQEVLPGDHFRINTDHFVRFAPMIAPIMHKVNASIHFFFVPNRLLWDKWEEFITGEYQSPAPMYPVDEVNVGSLADHMGLPIGEFDQSFDANVLPFRAYRQIYNDYFRDANLEEEKPIGDATDAQLFTQQCEIRAWEKDYFTSALPYPQLGIQPVSVEGTVIYKTEATAKGTGLTLAENLFTASTTNTDGSRNIRTTGASGGVKIENIDTINIPIEELRRSNRLQRWLERAARSGNRYFEHLRAFWGVNSKDARLQRSEYIGGGKAPVVVSEVANTTGTANAPQGNLSGNALSYGRSNYASKFCEEHGFIIGIFSVLPETAYYQGVPRMYDRRLHLDYAWPDFAQLGEQEVKKQEIYASDDNVSNQETFGYQSRYAEYKYIQNSVHGEFRNTLEFWHMGRKFNGTPNLNSDFIKAEGINEDPLDRWRVFAVDGTEQLYVSLWHNVKATRPLPFLNDPKL